MEKVDVSDPNLFQLAPTLIYRYTPAFLEKVKEQRDLRTMETQA